MKIVWLACALPAALLSQTATLRGVVTDTSGAAVPSARVSITGEGRAEKTQIADSKGVYSIGSLVPGAFLVQASAPQLILLKPVPVNLIAGPNVLDLQLSIAPVAERLDVAENNNTVGTDAAGNASAMVIRGADLDTLADDPEDLAADLQALAGPSAGPGGTSLIIDGFSGGELPPKESIREIRINQNPFSPEFDKLGIGRIEILTKPGSDHWRGNLNYNFATDAWNSRNPYSAIKAPLLLNEFENTISGPLGKRVSLTLDANQNNVDNGAIVNAVTLDPKTLTPAPFFDVFKTIQRRTRFYPRVDYQLNDRNTLSFRYDFIHGDIQGAGIGGFNLLASGYHTKYRIDTAQATDTIVLGTGAVNETRFQYYRNRFQTIPNSDGAEVQVLGAFTDGGSRAGNALDIQTNLEFQNYTTIVHGPHTWRFGMRARVQIEDSTSPQNFNGTFTFGGGTGPVLNASNQPVLDATGQPVIAQIQSIERYRRTLLFQQLGYSPAQIRALGGGATQFTIASGLPGVSASQVDVSPFVGDEWRVRPNLTLNLGLRYEAQTNIRDLHDWAPRIGVAWAPGGSGKKQPATVIRAGFGIFYDRFPLINTLTAKRYDGVIQQQYVVDNPDFFPVLPSLSSLAGSQSPQVVQKVDSALRAQYVLQSALTLERQLRVGTTVAVTYSNTRGVHLLRSLDINAPLPGSGLFPLGNDNPLFLMTSSGVFRQNQLSINVNSKISRALSLTGSYTFNRARSDTDGLITFPANPYNYSGEYGPAASDVHNRVSMGATINLKWNIRLSPLINIQSGPPFDITTGSDVYGTSLFNARPGLASNPATPGLIMTKYGLLDPNPSAGETVLPRNFGRGPGQQSVNLRIAKVIALGPEQFKPGGGSGGHRFNATIGMSLRNLLNHTNPGPIIGDITSPLFGQANQVAGNVNGEGFSENANNRRLEMQFKVTF